MHRNTLTLTTAGVLTMVASALDPDVGVKAAERYTHIAPHAGLEGLSALLYFVAGAAYVVAAILGFAHRPSGPGRHAVGAGAVMTGLVGLWLAASISAFGMLLTQLVDEVPRSAALHLIDSEARPWQSVYDLTLLCWLAGPAVVAFGLRRAGRLAWWPIAVYPVAMIGYGATEFSSVPGRVAALLVTTVVLVVIGRTLDTPASELAQEGSSSNGPTTARV